MTTQTLERNMIGGGSAAVDYIVVGAGSAGCAVARRLNTNAPTVMIGERAAHLPATDGSTSIFETEHRFNPEPGLAQKLSSQGRTSTSHDQALRGWRNTER